MVYTLINNISHVLLINHMHNLCWRKGKWEQTVWTLKFVKAGQPEMGRLSRLQKTTWMKNCPIELPFSLSLNRRQTVFRSIARGDSLLFLTSSSFLRFDTVHHYQIIMLGREYWRQRWWTQGWMLMVRWVVNRVTFQFTLPLQSSFRPICSLQVQFLLLV